uniref:UBX domain-containing protein n=1 Tax=Physcomitrium patens TaxID=3218 RepID=A0A7I4AU19_PHYPA
METTLSDWEEQLVMLEFMDIVGESADRARQFLQATGWLLNEAVQLYFAENNEVGGANNDLAAPVVSAPVLPEQATLGSSLDPGSSTVNDRNGDNENYVRPPLPVKREALYEDMLQARVHQAVQYPSHSFVDPFRNFEDEANQQSSWGAGEASTHVGSAGGSSRDSLAALYRPPFVFMFQGTFEQAKTEAAKEGKWLLVNVQSTTEFASYTLNRDTWGHEAVKDTVGTSFVFWQVYDDTEEGRKVCTYYKLLLMPSILVIDPITGQKMRSWEGMISAERLLEDLVRYMDMGPLDKQPIGFPPHKRPREAAKDANQPFKVDLEADEPQRPAVSGPPLVSGSRHMESSMEPSGALSGEKVDADVVAASAVQQIVYPSLSEEPENKAPGTCRVGVRFPDGSRSNRRFLMSDSVKQLWSFCSSKVKEAEDGRPFHLNQMIPGANRTLVYSSDASMEEAGVANAMLSMVWD